MSEVHRLKSLFFSSTDARRPPIKAGSHGQRWALFSPSFLELKHLKHRNPEVVFGAFEVNTYTASYVVSDKKFVYERNPLHRAFKKGQF